MIWKSFKFRWQEISITTWDYQIGLDVVQWKWLDVSDNQINVQWFHGIKLSPTFARGRRVTIEWIIIADDQIWSSKGIDYLENLFALQWIPSTVELLPFIVTDDQDREWELQAKIKEPLSIDIGDMDWQQWANRRFRVVLQWEDPRYYNAIENQVDWAEWYFWGAKLWVKLWVKMDDYFNEIQVIANWNVQSPLKTTITATWDINTPLVIRNLTDWTFFGLDIDAVLWDIIEIDSSLKTATKNGVNILANRIAWSTWPQAIWSTLFSFYDNDGWLVTSDFDVKINFRDVLL